MTQQIKAKKVVRLKRLKPSMREKKRYVVVALKKNLAKKQAFQAVDSALLEGVGLLGYSRASIRFIQFDAGKRRVILYVNRKQLANIKAALVLAGLACVGVSGTLRKARQKFL